MLLEPLRQRLILFDDISSFEEAEVRLIKYCFNEKRREIVKSDIQFVENYLNSDFSRSELRDFVEWRMNWALDDPTGEAHVAWLKQAVATMRSAIEKSIKVE